MGGGNETLKSRLMPIIHRPRAPVGGRPVREIMTDEEIPRDGFGVVPTNYAIQGPAKVPRIDYERIFVMDAETKLLAEYALRDDSPLEYEDLRRSIPVNGMRHAASFYQGEYAFTPFKVESLWLVVLTKGVPRIEERGSIGTLLAAMRLHLPGSLDPALAERESDVKEREQEVEHREASLANREARLAHVEAALQIASTKLEDLEAEVRSRETRLNALRDYALQMQRAFRQAGGKPPIPEGIEENPQESKGVVSPPP